VAPNYSIKNYSIKSQLGLPFVIVEFDVEVCPFNLSQYFSDVESCVAVHRRLRSRECSHLFGQLNFSVAQFLTFCGLEVAKLSNDQIQSLAKMEQRISLAG